MESAIHGYYYQGDNATNQPPRPYLAGNNHLRWQTMAANTSAPKFSGIRDSCSDTDSGICADSTDSQNSPRRLREEHLQLQRSPYIPPGSQAPHYGGGSVQASSQINGQRRPPPVPPRKPVKAPVVVRPNQLNIVAGRSQLNVGPAPPPRDQHQAINSGDNTTADQCIGRRVRFADEIDHSQRQWHQHDEKMQQLQRARQQQPPLDSDGQAQAYFYQLDRNAIPGVATNVTPQPPPYDIAFERLRQLRDASLDDDGEHVPVPPPLRYRSASLPRGLGRRHNSQQRQMMAPTNIPPCQVLPPNRQNYLNIFEAAKSLEDLTGPLDDKHGRQTQKRRTNNGPPLLRLQVPYELRAQTFDAARRQPPPLPPPHRDVRRNCCVIPTASFQNITSLDPPPDPAPTQPAPKHCRTKRSAKGSLPRSKSTSRISEYLSRMKLFSGSKEAGLATDGFDVDTDRPVQPLPSFYSQDRLCGLQNCQQVRMKLLGLDHRGIQTIVLEKLEPGPFGFFIATGCFKKRKGVFVSRVSLTSLAPLLSVGDELLSVDGQSVGGGRVSLEFVQSLIADRRRIVLQTLPLANREDVDRNPAFL